MASERPLHVRVAEALGWTDLVEVEVSPFGPHWLGTHPADHVATCFGGTITAIDRESRTVMISAAYGTVPPYGEDTPDGWACTGPLMQKYGIGAILSYKTMSPPLRGDTWMAKPWNPQERAQAECTTAAGAIARLIVAMAAAGTLPR